MNREIKFRGMSVNGKWHYGSLCILKEKGGLTKEGYYISNSVGMPFAYLVIPKTVGQYTGLNDKNGTEIYDGDIMLSAGCKEKYVIIWEHAGWFRKSCDSGQKITSHFPHANRQTVIGNIFANIELI